MSETSVKGKIKRVPTLKVIDTTITLTGRLLKIAEVHDEPWQLHGLEDPVPLVTLLKQRSNGADIFSFSQRPPDVKPHYPYPFVMDNVAAIKIVNYNDWWEKLPQETRKNVRRAAKRGVAVDTVPFDDRLIQGIKDLYDESPFRQGRRFWHYGKDLAAIRRENASYLERSEFIGAYCEEQLIGFLKMVYLGNAGRIMQIISKNSHYDKRPMNALIAKAVEVCAANGMSYFIYGKYVYGNNSEAPIIEFKRRNGFEAISFPKYYIPLSARGRIAVKLKLHLGLRRFLPKPLEKFLLNVRAKVYQRNASKKTSEEAKTISA